MSDRETIEKLWDQAVDATITALAENAMATEDFHALYTRAGMAAAAIYAVPVGSLPEHLREAFVQRTAEIFAEYIRKTVTAALDAPRPH